MTAETDVKTVSRQASDFAQKVQKLRDLYADASDFSRAALEKVIRALGSDGFASGPPAAVESAGRIGAREGKVSELTAILPLRPGGAKRMRAFLALHGNLGNRNVDLVGTVHDMRWVFLDNDTKVLFASTYDGDWDPYIDDFGTKIPDILDLQFGEVEGWPGIRSPEIKDFIVRHQIPAHFWYVASPNSTVVETKRLEKIGKAVDEFLDNIA